MGFKKPCMHDWIWLIRTRHGQLPFQNRSAKAAVEKLVLRSLPSEGLEQRAKVSLCQRYKAQAGQKRALTLGMAALVLALQLQAQGSEIDDHSNDDEADQIGVTENIKHVSVLRLKPRVVNT